MAGLDDLLGSLTKQGGGSGGGGLNDLLGGLLGGSSGGSQGGLGGLENVLGGLLGGGASGNPGTSAKGMNMAAVAAASASRLRRPTSGLEYLAAITSPCSVTRIEPCTAPGGCARIA